MPGEPACLSSPTVLFSLPFFLFLANQPSSLQLLCKFGALTQCVTSPSLNMGILNIEQIKTFQVGEFMYKYHHGLLSLAFRGFFKLGTEIHSYFTRNAGAYRPPFARSNTRLFSIKHVGS